MKWVKAPQHTRRSLPSLNDDHSLCATLYTDGGVGVNVWLQSRSLPARGRVGLEVHRCFIADAGNVFIYTVGELYQR
jgi:hypothetical protein